MAELDEIVYTVEQLRTALDDLAVRGLKSIGARETAKLSALREELERIGADHLAGRIAKLIEAIQADDRGAAAALLHAQASLRVFDRVLTLEAAAALLDSGRGHG